MASTLPRLPPRTTECRHKTPRGSLPPPWPPQTLLHLAGVTTRPSGLQTSRWPSITWGQNPGSPPCPQTPLPHGLHLSESPPPSSPWTTSPISLRLQSHTRDRQPSFLLREALSRPGPLSCGSLASLCVAGRGTSAHPARVRLGPRPEAAGGHRGPALPSPPVPAAPWTDPWAACLECPLWGSRTD